MSLNVGAHLSNSFPGESRLEVALTKEVGEHNRGEERIAEDNGTQDHSDEDDHFSVRDNLHGAVVVFYSVCELVNK